MTRLKNPPLLISIFSICFCYSAFGQEPGEKSEPTVKTERTVSQNRIQIPEVKLPIEELKRGKDKAYWEFIFADKSIESTALSVFDEMRAHPPTNFHEVGSPFFLILRLLGELKVEKAKSDLFEIIDFQLNPLSPSAFCGPRPLDYYPAAQALAEMGDKSTIDLLFKEIAKPRNEIQLRIYAQILSQCLGKELAAILVQMKLTAVNEWLAQGKIDTSARKENLEKMKTFFASEKTLLPLPTTNPTEVGISTN